MRYHEAEYGWIGEDMGRLRRDFLPGDLRAEAGAAGVAGVVSIQARQTVEETVWLLDLARGDDFIRAVVGWVPLVSPTVRDDLARFAAEPKLRGVRHVLQGEADERYMLRADFNAGISALTEFGLVYALLIFERQLPQTIEFVDRHPAQTFVLDHLAKPRIKAGLLEPWTRHIRALAQRPNIYCKISGMVTEADWFAGWDDELHPYIDTALEAFGSTRLIFGSDWPVCLVASTYSGWVETVKKFTDHLSPDEQARIFGGTAADAYRLPI